VLPYAFPTVNMQVTNVRKNEHRKKIYKISVEPKVCKPKKSCCSAGFKTTPVDNHNNFGVWKLNCLFCGFAMECS